MILGCFQTGLCFEKVARLDLKRKSTVVVDLVVAVAVTTPETVFAEAAEEERTAGGSREHHLSEYLALASVKDDQYRELKQRSRSQKQRG